MRRLYFIFPDINTAKTVVDELLLKRVTDHQIHVIAKDGAQLDDLPEANLMQTSDFIPAVERGLAVGGVTGILAGTAAVMFPPAGLALGGGTILFASLAGAVVGAWLSSMIGVSVANSQIQQFEKVINAGSILMMVDVPKSRMAEIKELVNGRHPNVMVGGTEPHIPAFP